MKDTELRQERDRELFATYVRGLDTRIFASLDEAAEWARSQPASRFYISPKSLAKYIGTVQQGKTSPRMFEENRRKMEILYGMYKKFKRENPSCRLSRDRICEELVNLPAPSFFIGLESTRITIQKERARHMKTLQRRFMR